jgi:hypothetical protein
MTMEPEPTPPNELPVDPLIKELVGDPKQIPNLIVLVGFLGRNTREDEEDDGYLRLYLTPTLNDYITFKRDDLVYHRPLSPERSPAGGSIVWLNRDATVRRTRIESRQLQAEFLRGKYMDNARMSMLGLSKEPSDECGCKRPCMCSCTCNTSRETIDDCPPSAWHCSPPDA